MKDQSDRVVLEFQRDARRDDESLLETRWVLELLNGHVLIPGWSITIAFDEGEKGDWLFGSTTWLYGNAGCNHYGITIELVNGHIIWLILPNIGGKITEIECSGPVEGVMEQEKEYVETLRSITTYEVSDNRLELKNQAGEVALVFRSGE